MYYAPLGILIAGGLLLGGLGALVFESNGNTQRDTLALWVWEDVTAWSENELQEHFSQLEKAGITMLFLDIGTYADIVEMQTGEERGASLANYERALADSIALAHQRGIAVHGLAGGPRWAEDSHTYLPPLFIDFIENFNRQHTPGFAGMHFDIEPHANEDYERRASEYIRNYLALAKATGAYVAQKRDGLGEEFMLSFAVPYWWAKEQQNSPRVSFAGREALAGEHLLALLDETVHSAVVLMAYRNYAEGRNGTLELALPWFTLGQDGGHAPAQESTRIFIGQETIQTEPEKVTFYGKTHEALMEEISRIRKTLGTHKRFGGVVVHDFKGFMRLYGKTKE